MDNIFSFEEENQVLVMEVPRNWEFDQKRAAEFLARIREIYQGKEHKFLICDVSESSGRPVSKDLRRWLSAEASRIGFEKVAIVGASPVNRMIARVVMAALRKSEYTRFFKSRALAFSWIRESTQNAYINGSVKTPRGS